MVGNSLWRINLKPNSINNIDAREFCINNEMLGFGWAVECENGSLTWDEYKESALKKYYYEDEDLKKVKPGGSAWWKAINALYNKMEIGDLCWTRDNRGIYYLGRITSEWQYKTDEDYVNADIVNIRKCDWIRIGAVDKVPGKVINSFTARSTLQRVVDETALQYSKLLFNQNSKEKIYDIDDINDDIFSLLSPEDCENVIGLYLQKELGYFIIPKTNKNDTVKYEFVLKHRETGEKAVVQVKNGNVDLNMDEFKGIADKVYLFTTKGSYIGTCDNSIICLEQNKIKEFIFNNKLIMPDLVVRWIDYLNYTLNNLT